MDNRLINIEMKHVKTDENETMVFYFKDEKALEKFFNETILNLVSTRESAAHYDDDDIIAYVDKAIKIFNKLKQRADDKFPIKGAKISSFLFASEYISLIECLLFVGIPYGGVLSIYKDSDSRYFKLQNEYDNLREMYEQAIADKN